MGHSSDTDTAPHAGLSRAPGPWGCQGGACGSDEERPHGSHQLRGDEVPSVPISVTAKVQGGLMSKCKESKEKLRT